MDVSKRQMQKENTRRRIIETAYRVFSEKGFGATTSDIAKEAGVSHGCVFAHFPTLNDLLICLLSEFGKSIGLKLHGLAENKHSIEELLNVHIEVLEEYEDFYTRFISEMNMLPDEAKDTFVMIQSSVAFHFQKVTEYDISTGKIKNIEPHMLFNTWIAIVHYYLQNKGFFAPEGRVLKRYKSELIKNYLKLISNI